MKTSSFFDYKKNCRKSAWATPEHLSDEDWAFTRAVVKELEGGTPDSLFALIWEDYGHAMAFFNRILGWPEGLVYCQELSYVHKCAFAGLQRHDLPRLKEAIAKNNPAPTI